MLLGIDVGKTGAVCVYNELLNEIVEVYPFKKDIDFCRKIIFSLGKIVSWIFIEQVYSSPQMGVTSAFTFGRWFEVALTSAKLSNKNIILVRPQVWQGALGCLSGGDKKYLYTFAKTLCPKQTKKFNQSSADSVLIAIYGSKYVKYKYERSRK